MRIGCAKHGLLPISVIRLWASSDKKPRVSTTTRKNMWLAESVLDLVVFLADVATAALPTCSAFSNTQNVASVWATVTSHVALHPDCHGTNVKPSGLFPSSLPRPWGSITAGVSARIRARWIKSLSQAWHWTLPECFLQNNTLLLFHNLWPSWVWHPSLHNQYAFHPIFFIILFTKTTPH